MKILVLGAGLVGSAIAIDLSKNFEVVSADLNAEALEKLNKIYQIRTVHTDLSDEKKLNKLVANFDLVVGAVPGFMGYKTLKTVIEAGKNMVDISFFPEDMFGLDELAKKHGVTAITDCGVAPGMGNIILGYHNANMQVTDYKCFVGGLPQVREWPFEYKAVFSPIDVIEEYLRPARYVQNGCEVVREALSDPEHLFFEGLGTLEAWNSDGLRSLIKTMPNIPNMIEKTMRYPGAIEYLRVLRASGFFSYDEIEVKGVKIRPIDLTAKLVFPKWKLKPGEGDLTVMRIIIEGNENGKSVKYTYTLNDRYDAENDTISMARTTGFTCTAAATMLAKGLYKRIGINPPEYLGEDATHFEFMLNYLKERGVIYAIERIG